MKYIKLFSVGALTIALASCGNAPKEPTYVVEVPLPDVDGHIAYIVDYDNDSKIDSTTVSGGVALFEGTVGSPVMARIIIDGRRAGSFVLENDSIKIENGAVYGGELNGVLRNLDVEIDSVQAAFRALPDSVGFDEAAYNDAIRNVYEKAMIENLGNPVGYYTFLQQIYEMNLQQADSLLERYPEFSNYTRVDRVRKAKAAEVDTAEGMMFKDFEVTYNDTTYHFADYVGKGRFTLVDFWASWCGPCIRQTRVIKELYEQYGNKGLDVLGVAVWDEPENTLAAVEAHKLPWPEIINAQRIPTDLYGISSIPCIILFGPDGKIISRGKQDDALRHAVAQAMGFEKPQAE